MGCWGGRLAVGLAVVAALLTSGCPKRPSGLEGEGATEGVQEESLGAADSDAAGGARGSLAAARAGTLGSARDSGPLRDIPFDYDSFELGEEARAALRDNADWLKDSARARVELEGHCDDRGTVEYNLALGAKRAAEAKSYLVSMGVAGDRITTISYGEELPLCHEPTESCWQKNRRAHFVVVGE